MSVEENKAVMSNIYRFINRKAFVSVFTIFLLLTMMGCPPLDRGSGDDIPIF